jgi:hypothetical protein
MTALAIKRSAVIAFLHYLFLLGEMGYMRGVIEGYWKRVCRVCVWRSKKLRNLQADCQIDCERDNPGSVDRPLCAGATKEAI